MGNVLYSIGVVLLFTVSTTSAQALTHEIYQPNQESQEYIDKIIYTDYSIFSKDEGEKALKSMVDTLVRMNDDDRVKTIREVYYFSVYSKPRGDATQNFWIYVGFFLTAKFTITEGIEAALPFLDSNDHKLKMVAYEILLGKVGVPIRVMNTEGIESDDLEGKGDIFDLFTPYMRQHPKSQKLLLDLMFQDNPPKALMFAFEFYGLEADKERLSDNLTKSSKRWGAAYKRSLNKLRDIAPLLRPSLNELSLRKEWWARMYVAEVIRQVPSLQTTELVERLNKDRDPYIQASMKILEDQARKSAQPRFKIFYGLDSVDKPE